MLRLTSAPIIDFATAFKGAIQAGETVVEGNVVRIVADNGAAIGNGAFKVIQGGNGVATEAYAMTGAVEGGTATTSGLSLLFLDLGVAGAAIAPCLGVLAGVGLYNLAPEFWTDVSDALVNAGKTVGGKVAAYFDGDNIYFDEATIETYKNALLDSGIFNASPTATANTYNPIDPSLQPEFSYSFPVPSSGKGYINREGSYSRFTVNNGYLVNVITSDHSITTNSWGMFVIGPYNTCSFSDGYDTTNLRDLVNVSRFTVGSTTYGCARVYGGGGDASSYRFSPAATLTSSVDIIENQLLIARDLLYLLYNNSDVSTTTGYENLQPDATYPTSGQRFPLTYPDWYPFNYPSVAPSGLPNVYPAKYPNTEPDPYPNQEGAQNPDPENAPETYPHIIPDLPIPRPTPEPTPEPEPDPDPQPIDPEPVPEIDPEPEIDPIDPNPDPIPTPPPYIPDLPDTVNSNRLFTVYNPSESQLNGLGGFLWDSSLIETLKKIWQNPLDGVISLIQVYCTPSTGASQHIILGYLDSNVSAPVVTSQFATIDCGSVTINEDKHNATDYSPYSALHVYLPFIGVVELNINEFMNGSMNIVYKVDVYTGTCIATIKSTRSPDVPNGARVYEFSGNCSQQIPLTSSDAKGVLTAVIGATTAALGIASGGGLGVVAGATMVGNSLTHEMLHINHSGNLSANAGILGGKKPYVILTRRHCYDANNYSSKYGYPSNKTVFLGNHVGEFFRVKAGFLKTSATQPEHDLIMELLNEGVIG